MRANRLRRLAFVSLAILMLLIGRLFQLQIQEHDHWVKEARNSRLDRDSIPFRRGRILDRNGVVLAMDRPAFDLYFRYRDFRQGHLAGQLLEALHLMGIDSGGLDACLRRGEELGAICLSWTPQDLAILTPRQRNDLVYYLRRLAGMGSSRWYLPVRDWAAEGTLAFQQRFPQARQGLAQGLAETRREVALLEELLGPEWLGQLIPQLERRRQELQVMVLRGALQGAAAQALDESSAILRGRLARTGEVRNGILRTLCRRWGLEAEPSALGALLLPLEDPASLSLKQKEPLELSALLDTYLTGLEANFPEDAKGQRRSLVRRVHHDRVVVMRRDLDFPLVDLLAQQHEDYPGLYLTEVARRIYPDDVSPLLVGATRQVNPGETEEYETIQDRFMALRRLFHRTPEQEAEFRQIRDRLWSDTLRPDETRGATGVELVYEEQLRGSRGYLQVLEGGEEDGLPLELLFSPPRNGSDIVLSLDAAMEQAAFRVVEEVYRDTPGRLHTVFPETPEEAFLAFDPRNPRVGFALLDLRTGETPLLMSTPTFTREEYRRDYAVLREIRGGSPLRNRALGGGYYAAETPFPGSTFKPLVAAAALHLDPALWDQVYHCAGMIEPIPGGRALKCDSRWGHGDVAMREALKKSCNVYFYLLAKEIGAEAIHGYAKGLGFDRPTGMELVQFDPTAAAVDPFRDLQGDARLERKANYLDDLASLDRSTMRLMQTAIGQVGVQASPLQMARFYGWLATGELLQPRLVQSGGGGSPARVGMEVPIVAPAQRARILDALSAVSYEEGGTAARTEFPAAWGIVGKTGTAQVAAGSAEGGLAPTHAWFTGFFPAEDPRYAFAILCENTGLHGGQVASFILKEFLETPEAASLLHAEQ